MFVGIFTYCIVVLRTIRGGDEAQVFVPSIAVVTGVLLALVGIGFLIYFIHHIAVSIQASTIIADIYEETVKVVDEIFPHRLGENAPVEELESLRKFASEANWQMIRSTETGYIQNIDVEALLNFTKKGEVVVKMEHGVGEFVVAGAPIASVNSTNRTADLNVDSKTTKRLNDIFSFADFRTVDQDVAFGIRQIVDIVMKALSPGVNDTTTAVISIDYLTAICSHLAAHPFPSCYRYTENQLRVIAKSPSFEDLVDLAFNQPRQNATNNVAVILRILHALEQIARRIEDGHDLHGKSQNISAEERAERLQIIARHLQMTADEARENVESKDDWAQIEEHIGKVLKKLDWENKISFPSSKISAAPTNS